MPFYLEEQALVIINTKDLKNVTKVPVEALSFYDKKDGVWILNSNNTVTFKPISILSTKDNFIATKDLKNNQILIVQNPKNKSLSNGMKIYTSLK
jgi:hypothetical protein